MVEFYLYLNSLLLQKLTMAQGLVFQQPSPLEAEDIYNHMVGRAKELNSNIESGIFAADMKVALVNDGPVTFLLKC